MTPAPTLSDFTELEIAVLRNIVEGMRPGLGMKLPGYKIVYAKRALRTRGALNVADRPTPLGRELVAAAEAEGLRR